VQPCQERRRPILSKGMLNCRDIDEAADAIQLSLELLLPKCPLPRNFRDQCLESSLGGFHLSRE